MHVFNDNGWFTGQEIPALLQAHVYSGFRYQVIDIKKHSGPSGDEDLFLRRS
ncbi:HMP-PP phosphatase [Salmonella enterica subsp. enterica]|nr:HMP-PP phosphatase [Salmonella enterica subsp. enterica]